MRTRTLLLAAVLAVSTVACQREASQGQDAAPAASPEPVAEQAAPPAAQLPPIGDGVTFPFSYTVNKDRVVSGKAGTRSREVLLEYGEGDLKQVDERVRHAFKARGYARPTPATRNGAIHSTYRKDGQPDVRVWVREGLPPGGRFQAVSSSMRGTIYLVTAQDAQ